MNWAIPGRRRDWRQRGSRTRRRAGPRAARQTSSAAPPGQRLAVGAGTNAGRAAGLLLPSPKPHRGAPGVERVAVVPRLPAVPAARSRTGPRSRPATRRRDGGPRSSSVANRCRLRPGGAPTSGPGEPRTAGPARRPAVAGDNQQGDAVSPRGRGEAVERRATWSGLALAVGERTGVAAAAGLRRHAQGGAGIDGELGGDRGRHLNAAGKLCPRTRSAGEHSYPRGREVATREAHLHPARRNAVAAGAAQSGRPGRAPGTRRSDSGSAGRLEQPREVAPHRLRRGDRSGVGGALGVPARSQRLAEAEHHQRARQQRREHAEHQQGGLPVVAACSEPPMAMVRHGLARVVSRLRISRA